MSSSKKNRARAPQNLSIPEALAKANAHWNAGQADQADMLCQRVLAHGRARPMPCICSV